MGNGTSAYAQRNDLWVEPPRLRFAAPWLPVLTMLALIAAESTRAAGTATTLRLLSAGVTHLHLGAWFRDLVLTNNELRKLGHFTGYGLLGLLTARAWHLHTQTHAAERWKTVLTQAASIGVLCAGTVAAMDEWHQDYLPGRHACMEDVAIDPLGAASFVLLYVLVYRWNRRNA